MPPASFSGTIGITGLSTPEKNTSRHYCNEAAFTSTFQEKPYSHSLVLRTPRFFPSKPVLSYVLLKAHQSSTVLSVVPFCTLTCYPNGLHSFPKLEILFLNATLDKLTLVLVFLCAR